MPRWPEKKVETDSADEMNAYALRVWEGQSPDLHLKERTVRVVKALKGQGFDDVKSLKLPVSGYERYL